MTVRTLEITLDFGDGDAACCGTCPFRAFDWNYGEPRGEEFCTNPGLGEVPNSIVGGKRIQQCVDAERNPRDYLELRDHADELSKRLQTERADAANIQRLLEKELQRLRNGRDAARDAAEAEGIRLSRCSRCGCVSSVHRVDDEELRECLECECTQYEAPPYEGRT